MKDYFDRLKDFYLRNRLWIIGGLFFLLMMQICSEGGRVNHQSAPVMHDQELTDDAPVPLEALTPSDDEIVRQRPTINSNYLFLLMGLGLLLVVALRRKWLNKLMPDIVWISHNFKHTKLSKTTLVRISVINKTHSSITFQSPVLVFGSPFAKSRKFRLKNGGDNVFPLILTPNTSHRLTIDIDQFRQKAGLEKDYRWVKVEIDTSQMKKYSSLWKYQI